MGDTRVPLDLPFASRAQQARATSMGMWVFIGTELMFFSGLFLGYLVYRHAHAEAFAQASKHLDLVLGTANTALLLTSSLLMACAVLAARQWRSGLAALLLAATACLGIVFLAIKGLEWHHEYSKGLVPFMTEFRYDGPHPQQAALFFNLYFLMTGLHALHLALGVVAVLGLAAASFIGALGGRLPRRTEILGLYWHFVDAVWVFLFPLLYLIGRAGS